MRKIGFLWGLLLLVSCANETQMPKEAVMKFANKTTLMNADGSFTNTQTTCNGNKIVCQVIEKNVGGAIKHNYYYTGDVISRIEHEQGMNGVVAIEAYTYTNGKIATYIQDIFGSENSSKVYFTYLENGEIAVRHTFVNNSTKKVVLEFNETFFYDKGNFMKSILKSIDKDGLNRTKIITYEYDNMNNPTNNILGFSLLFGMSVNNITKETTEIFIEGQTEPISKVSVLYTYQYNANKYPVKCTSTTNTGVYTQEYNY